jgi:hypothetical protein
MRKENENEWWEKEFSKEKRMFRSQSGSFTQMNAHLKAIFKSFTFLDWQFHQRKT